MYFWILATLKNNLKDAIRLQRFRKQKPLLRFY